MCIEVGMLCHYNKLLYSNIELEAKQVKFWDRHGTNLQVNGFTSFILPAIYSVLIFSRTFFPRTFFPHG